MVEKEKNTEKKILDTASEVFLKKGMTGARMQEIADAAGINKSLLHYYYRSKEKLFTAVFQQALQYFFPGIVEIIRSDMHLFEKVDKFVNKYIEVLLENPFVPLFVLHEIHRDPENLYEQFQHVGIDPALFLGQFKEDMEAEDIEPMDPRHFLINVLSLCIFPVAARPMMKKVLFENDDEAYRAFLEERKKEVSEFVKKALKK